MALDTSNMLSETVVLVDCAYIEKVAFDLSVNFERMLERRIPKADLPLWLDCIALDGGITPGDNSIQVIFIHNKSVKTLENFTPSCIQDDINGKAFKDSIGEFSLEAYPVADDITTTEEFFNETLRILLDSDKVKNIMLVPEAEEYGHSVAQFIAKHKDKSKDKDITLFAMQPVMGNGFSQQILGYSLMHALGIKGDELKG